jgi:hypothetical protein
MRFCGCDTSVSSGSMYGCSVMVLVVGDAAELQGRGRRRRRPEPGRLYAAEQANSDATGNATLRSAFTVRRRRGDSFGGGSGGDVVVGVAAGGGWEQQGAGY